MGQNTQKFTPGEMGSDIDSLVKYLEEVHPNPYYRYPKASFYKDVATVKKSLHEDLNIFDFYLKIVPLLGKLDDGHTDLHIINRYQTENPFIIPYDFDLSPFKPYIIGKQTYPSISSQIPNGAEIISINNVPTQQIVNDVINLNTGENRVFRAQFGATRFYFYLEALYKSKGVYNVKYKSKGTIANVVIKGIKQSEFESLKNRIDLARNPNSLHSNFSLQILDNNKTALINFKSFDWEGFTSFMDSAFTIIQQKNIENLIINLIDDSGGDSDVGDSFFQYILNKPFRQYDKVLEKNSELLKERLKKHLAEKNRQADSSEFVLLNRKNGSFDTTYYDYISIAKNPLRFNGKIYLLVNLQTYSSAADFAQCFKYQKRGLIIGEETGGLVESYGDIVTAYLPITHIEMSVSSKLYYDAGTKEGEWYGVIPDVSVPADKAMEKALEIIKQTSKTK